MKTIQTIRQEEGLARCAEVYETSDRLIWQGACGTGKTEAAIMLVRHFKPERTLLIVPTLELVKQMLGVWREAFPDVSLAAFCSKKEVGEYNGVTFSSYKQPEGVSGFAVVVTTYSSAKKLQAQPWNLVLGDEGHHMQAKTYREVMTWTQVNRFALFTATPAVLLRAANSDSFGRIATSYKHPDAVKDGVLTPVEAAFVVSRQLRPKTAEDVDDNSDWIKKTLRRLVREKKMRKAILFCRTTAHVDALAASQALGLSSAAVTRAAREGTKCAGLYWSYVDDEEVKP